MSNESQPVSVRILDKEYRVACKKSERDTLLESSKLLDAKMREIRESGKVLGTDRIAVMAALNLASELIEVDREHKGEPKDAAGVQGIATRIRVMQNRIDNALKNVEIRPVEELEL